MPLPALSAARVRPSWPPPPLLPPDCSPPVRARGCASAVAAEVCAPARAPPPPGGRCTARARPPPPPRQPPWFRGLIDLARFGARALAAAGTAGISGGGPRDARSPPLRPGVLQRLLLLLLLFFAPVVVWAGCGGGCSAGNYCVSQTCTVCSGIAAGFYCPGGSSTVATGVICVAGSYCNGGASALATPCPAGKYGSSRGLSTVVCSGLCTAGYVCAAGSSSATAATCGVGYACPKGTNGTNARLSCACSAGYYSSGSTVVAVTDCTGTAGSCVACAAGYQCTRNSRSACTCTAGYYSSATASASPCAGTAATCVLGAAGYKCSGGAAQPTACTCTAGYSAPAGTSSCFSSSGQCLQCGAGVSCTGGSATPVPCTCAVGYVSSVKTSSGCAGTSATCAVCAAGYSCAGGSSQAVACGAGKSCAGGNATPVPCTCAVGYVSSATTSSGCAGSSPTCAACAAGFSCAGGGTSQAVACTCAARYVSSASGSSSCDGTAATCIQCAAGYTCAGSGAQQAACSCTSGYTNRVLGVTGTCTGTSGACAACGAGSSCAGNAVQAVSCNCSLGYASAAATSSSCSGTSGTCSWCGAGNWCSGGSSVTVSPCTCTPGYVSSAASSGCAGSSGTCALCTAGKSCAGGAAQSANCVCSPGYYSPVVAVVTCTGTTLPCMLCTAGYKCNGNQTQPSFCNCTAGYYQPAGLSGCACVVCTAGNSCAGDAAVPTACTCAGGYFSPAGIVTTCAGTVAPCTACNCTAGYFSPGGGAAACTGTAAACTACTAGNACAGHAAVPVACTCAPGYFSAAGVVTTCAGTAASCASCSPGNSCAGNSAQQVACVCSAGYASASAISGGCTTNTGTCATCPAGKSCAGGAEQPAACICAPGYFSAEAASAACSGSAASCFACAAGYFCTGSSAQPVGCTCSAGYYSPAGVVTVCSGTTGACMACSAGKSCAGLSAAPAPCTCSAGYASPAGVTTACAGTGGPCTVCAPGYYCAGGSAVPAPCATAGYWCPAGASNASTFACAAGYFGDAPTASIATDATCFGICSCVPGAYCPAASVVTNGVPCPPSFYCTGSMAQPVSCTANPGFYCPAGSSSSNGTLCVAGAYCIGGSALPVPCAAAPGACCPMGSSVSSGEACPAGSWCAGGAAPPVACAVGGYWCPASSPSPTTSPCAVSRWGSAAGAATYSAAMCAGPCAIGGYWCPAGSGNATAATCDAGAFGVAGNAYTSSTCAGLCACSPGSYCPSASASSNCVACFAGSYCMGGGSTPVVCSLPGFFCAAGSSVAASAPCQAGNYGSSPPYSTAACAGLCTCSPGNFCAAASPAAAGTACAVGFACAGGSAQPVVCSSPGYWCPALSYNVTSAKCAAGYWGGAASYLNASCAGPCTCTPGRFCSIGGSEISGVSCPALSYCVGGTAAPATCTVAGYFCAAGSSIAASAPCQAGNYGSSPPYGTAACAGLCTCSRGNFCAAASPAAAGTACAVGFACAGGSAQPVVCSSPGYWCPALSYNVTSAKCAAGYWGGAASYLNASCAGPCTCALGRFCPIGGSEISGVSCPALSYCVGGTAAPATCTVAGYFCAAGSSVAASAPCQAGNFGSSPPYGTAACAGRCTCSRGNFCAAASPAAAGTACAVGFACAGGSAPPVSCLEPGYWCPARSWSASATPCDAGRFGGGTVNYLNSSCAGACASGYWCPPASVTPTALLCPGGVYSSGGAGSSACTGPCAASYFCAPGSGNATAAECPAGAFCAVGSAAPVPCPAGRYGAVLLLSLSACTGPCAPGYYCVSGSSNATAAACPAGRYSAAPGAVRAECDGACAPGFYCPPASTSSATAACPPGTYGAAPGGLGTAECSGPCPAGAFCGAGTVVPSACAPGTFAASPGAVACAACSAGAYAGVPGSTLCAPCGPDSYSMPGSVACVRHARLAVSGSSVCGVMPGGRKLCWPGPRPVWGAAVAEVVEACGLTVGGALVCGGEGNASVAPLARTGAGPGAFVSVVQAASGVVCALLVNGSVACFATSDLSAVVAPPVALQPPVLLQLSCDGGGGVADAAANCCGLRPNGSATCSRASDGAAHGGAARAGPYSLLATRGGQACAIVLASGLAECWALEGGSGVASPPTTPLSAITVGGPGLACGVARADGSLVCWPPLPGAPAGGGWVAVSAAGSAATGAYFVCVRAPSGVISCGGGGAPVPPLACPPPSSDLPGLCVFVQAAAADAGGAPGINAGDTVTLSFSVDVGAVCPPLAPLPADVAALLSFSSPPGASYSAAWASPAALVITLLDTRGASIDATRIGALSVTLLGDSCIDAGAVAGVPFGVRGSWGPWPAPVLVSAVADAGGGQDGLGAGDGVLLRFDTQTNRAAGADGALVWSAPLGALAGTWLDPWTLHVVVTRPPAGAAGALATAVGVLRVLCAGSGGAAIVSRDLSSRPCDTDVVVGSGGWGNSIVAVYNGDELPTHGGNVVTLVLSVPVGGGARSVAAVRAVYANAAHKYEPTGCTIAPADGASVSCVSAVGVGVAFAWVLSGGGLDNATSAPVSRYEAPVLEDVVLGRGETDVATAGGDALAYAGAGFGALDADLAPVRCVPLGGSGEVFEAATCHITTPHTGVLCSSPPLRGLVMQCTLTVGGQRATFAQLPTAAPVITAVVVASRTTDCSSNMMLCTAGGDTVRLVGDNFGATADGVVVTYNDLTAVDCAVVVPHAAVECRTVRGTGAHLLWSVSVLDRTSATFPALSYAPPRVLAVSGSLAARGFLAMVSCINCAEAPVAALFGSTSVSTAALAAVAGSPTLLIVAVPPSSGAPAAVVLVMAGVQSEVFSFEYAAPLVTVVDILGIDGGGRHTLSLVGSNFVVGATSVTIAGSPCALGGAGAVTDSSIECSTTHTAGTMIVAVGDRLSAPFLFNASAPQTRPLVSTVTPVAGGMLRLAAGGDVVISGAQLRATLPGVTRVLRAPFSCANGIASAVDACVATTVTISSIRCTLPPWGSTQILLVVAKFAPDQCITTTPVLFSYAPAATERVTPRLLDPAGGEVLVFEGDNYNVDTVVKFGGVVCAMVTRNATHLVCVAPPGVGAVNVVAVASPTAGPAAVPPAGLFISRRPPVIVDVSPAVLPTVGGAAFVRGLYFGAAPVVLLDNAPAQVISVTAAAGVLTLAIAVPAGVGAGHRMSVFVGDQQVVAARTVVYEPPVVTGANVPFVDAADGCEVTLYGSGFGPLGTPVAVTVGAGTVCGAAVVVDDSRVACFAAGFQVVVFAGVVTVTVGGQHASFALPLMCPAGTFGSDGELCVPCPLHAVCYGGVVEPVPMAGFYRISRTDFGGCSPPGACIALPTPTTDNLVVPSPVTIWARVSPMGGGNKSAPANNCAEPAYTGVGCTQCGAGFYRLNAPCVPCPKNPAGVFVLYGVLVCTAMVALQWAYRHRAQLKGLTVGIDFLQVMAMFAAFNFRWPPLLTGIFSVTNFFAFNFAQEAAPECTIKVTFFVKWLAVQLFPLCIVGAVALSYGTIIVVAVLRAIAAPRLQSATAVEEFLRKLRAKIGRQYDLGVGSCLTVLYYLYFVVVRGALELFDCDQDAVGHRFLSMAPNIGCLSPEHMAIVPYGVGSLLFYGVGVPAYFGLTLWIHRAAMRRDVRLWVHGLGDSAETNPDYWVRRRYSRLYIDYKPDVHWWRLVLIVRKGLLVCVSVMFTNNPTFQAAAVLFVFLVAYTLHVRFLPFLSAIQAPDPMHTMATNSASGGAVEERRTSRIDAATAAAKNEVLRQIVDLNVLEGTMLRSAVFVLIGGLMFASGAFGAYDSIGATVLALFVGALVVGSSLLFVFMIAYETRAMLRSQKTAGKTASSLDVSQAQALAKREKAIQEQLLVMQERLLGHLPDGVAPLAVFVNPMHTGRIARLPARRRASSGDWRDADAAVAVPVKHGSAVPGRAVTAPVDDAKSPDVTMDNPLTAGVRAWRAAAVSEKRRSSVSSVAAVQKRAERDVARATGVSSAFDA